MAGPLANFEEKRAELVIDPAPSRFAAAFGPISRRLGKAELALDQADLAVARETCAGWQPVGLTVEQAARILLLLDIAKTQGQIAGRLKDLAATADLGELIAIYKGLPLYPEPASLVSLAIEGLRTSVRAVFEAVAQNNPFPAEHFPQSSWNQMVLKALFIESALHPIAGLDKRWNIELARMLIDYANERRAADRPVTPELWRGVGQFGDTIAIAELVRVLDVGDPISQKAAALALCESGHPAASRALARRRDFADAVAAGNITWADVYAGVGV
jgi:hypothetical protein